VIVVQALHESFYAGIVRVGDYSGELVSYKTRYVTASDQITIFVVAHRFDVVACSLCRAYDMPGVISYDKDPLTCATSTVGAS